MALPVVAPGEDVYDVAYRWGYETPHLRDLVLACYKGPDVADNARRFRSSEEFRAAAALVRELGASPPGRVLDIGCGNGVASHALAREGYEVVAIDSSPGDLAGVGAARRLVGFEGVHFEVRHAPQRGLDFADATFDVLWMREVLHHVADLTAFLGEVRRVLQPGGVVCCMRDVVIWNEAQRAHFFANHPFYPITHDEGCYYLDEYLGAFAVAGLEPARVLGARDSVINTYPEPFQPGAVFDVDAARRRREGYDIFSFFFRRPRA